MSKLQVFPPLALLLLILLPASGWAQVCATPGKDGGTVSAVSVTGIVNTYYPSETSAAAGSTLIGVGLPSPGGNPAIGAGDLLLVLQVQGARIDTSNNASYGDGVAGGNAMGFLAGTRTAGTHELVVATGPRQTTGCPVGATGCIPITGDGAGGGLVNSYSHLDSPARDRFQVIRVPQYFSAVLASGAAALPWDGSVGGVLAIDVASTLGLGGATVDLTGDGFRGGGGRSLSGGGGTFSNTDYVRPSTVGFHASKGEGIAGTPRYVYDGSSLSDLGSDAYPGGGYSRGAPANAGGGGNDWVSSNAHNSGGGGGGGGADGGNGGRTWNSAQNVWGQGGAGTAGVETSLLLLGGGGGAGTSNNAGPGHGARGGGIFWARAQRLSGSGTIRANGAAAPTSRQDGAGGGGGGGTVSVATCGSTFGTLTLEAQGGDGGDVDWNVGDFHGPGGGGGGGILLTSETPSSTSVTGGIPGISPTANNFGAVAGQVGDTSSALAVTVAGASPGCACLATNALVTEVRTGRDEDGPFVAWHVAAQAGSTSFEIFRQNRGDWRSVGSIPALPDGPGTGWYRLPNPDASGDGEAHFVVLETDVHGRELIHGPFRALQDKSAPQRSASVTQGESLTWPLDGAWRSALSQRLPSESATKAEAQGVDLEKPSALRLEISNTGWYLLSRDELASAFGVPYQQVEAWVRRGGLRLEFLGRRVAWTPDELTGGILFYGQGPDELPGTFALTAPHSVYFLRPAQGDVMKIRSAVPRGPLGTPAFVPARFELEAQVFPATVAGTDPQEDFWFWTGAAAATAYDTAAVTFDTPGVVSGPKGARITVRLRGANAFGEAIDHQAEIRLNGQFLGEVTWAGLTDAEGRFDLPSGILLEEGNQLEVRALLPSGVDQSFFYLDSVTVEAPRRPLVASGAGFLPLDLTSASRVVELGPIPSGELLLFENSRPHRPRRVVGFQHLGSTMSFRPPLPGTYELVPRAALKRPGAVLARATVAEPLASRSRRADLLLVTSQALRAGADGWADYRRADGLEVEVVEIETLYDELTFGLASPDALRTLIELSRRWQLPPRAVLLLGDGHFDYRDRYGLNNNPIPPALVATADGLFASDRSLLPKDSGPLSIGRIPANSVEQVLAVLDKVRVHESTGGDWGSTLLLADDSDAGGDFAAALGRMESLLDSDWRRRSVVLEFGSVATSRDTLFQELDEGIGWLHYFGHGGIDRLASEGLLTSADVPNLPRRDSGFLLSALTCNVGRFEFPGIPSLAGSLVTEAGGGALAVLSPTGLAFHSQAEAFGVELARALGTTGPRRLGEALWEAEKAFLGRGGDPGYLELLHLFGDPMLRLP